MPHGTRRAEKELAGLNPVKLSFLSSNTFTFQTTGRNCAFRGLVKVSQLDFTKPQSTSSCNCSESECQCVAKRKRKKNFFGKKSRNKVKS